MLLIFFLLNKFLLSKFNMDRKKGIVILFFFYKDLNSNDIERCYN